MSADDYHQFLETKIKMAPQVGFDVPDDAVNPALFGFQRDVVRWGVAGGRRAYFLRFGLGKTVVGLETERLILERAGGAGLIIMPQDVRHEFRDDARNVLGWTEELPFIRRMEDMNPNGINLTNYETVRDGKLDVSAFTVVDLDEAAVLRSYGSKTFQEFLTQFEDVRFKYVQTAIPSPNRFKELIHYAGFLGVMDTGQALTRFFGRNSQKAGDLQLYPHKAQEFFLWLNSWAIFLQKPSDLGYSDDGYQLPELVVRWHEVQSELMGGAVDGGDQLKLIRDAAVGLQAESKEKRDSLTARIGKAVEIRTAEPKEHFILWHDLEAEREALQKALPQVTAVYGTMDPNDREQAIIGFKAGKVTDLAAKPVMLGAGGNLQKHCRRAIFAGVTHKFHDLLQAIYRIYRFGQKGVVEIDLIYTELEREVRKDIERKWAQDSELRASMSRLIAEHGLSRLSGFETLSRTMGVDRREESGDRWRMIQNDCVVETRTMAESSVDMILTSIPFGTQYEYCARYEDFGHNDDNASFWAQMDHLTPNLLRVLKPGRLAFIHVKDRLLFGSVTGDGRYTVEPFHAETIQHFRRHGFLFMGQRAITTDVVAENNQTYRLSYGEMLKDSTKMGPGGMEYLLMFARPQSDRSKGYADERVAHDRDDYSLAQWQIDAHGYWRSSGDRLLTPEEYVAMAGPKHGMKRVTAAWAKEQAGVYDFARHVDVTLALQAVDRLPKTYMALPPISPDPAVWTDISRINTLNGEAAAQGREKHVCPFQIDIVDRVINLYSNKGDLVFDPFGGYGTVPLRARILGRRGLATELHSDYFDQACRFLRYSESDKPSATLFDFLDGEAA